VKLWIKEHLNRIREPKVVFDGIRVAESNIRRQYIPTQDSK